MIRLNIICYQGNTLLADKNIYDYFFFKFSVIKMYQGIMNYFFKT